MLQFLRIENLALMAAEAIEFRSGFTAVTGETGAGKSVLLGALSLLAGNRAEKSLIREGADQCVVEAILATANQPRIARQLESAGLPACEDDQLLLKRIINRNKTGRIFINGSIATRAQLQELSGLWIDFHGPGEPQKLFSESEQLRLLDTYAGLNDAVRSYRHAYQQWRDAEKKLLQLQGEQRLSPEESAFLKNQIDAIDALKLSSQRIQQLESDFKRVSSSQEILQLGTRANALLSDEDGVCDQLRSLLPILRQLAQLDPDRRQLADRVESLLIETDDIASDVQQLSEGEDLNPETIQKIESDMETWLSLSRKYGPGVDQVLAKRSAMAERLAIQGNIKEVIAQQKQAITQLAAALQPMADHLRTERKKAGLQLAKTVQSLLELLGFKRPQFAITISSHAEPGPFGDCTCSFTFSPNPGVPPMPLNKIASSGEMARVMLAIKSILAAADATPVLVFDEVDANIGGEVASAVADRLRQLGHNHQVFCITHLPQVAACANQHFVVQKQLLDDHTRISIACLDHDPDAKLDEFARMLGDRNSPAARQHALSLLQSNGE